jgi:Domain of unknown function (DUF4485)
MRWIHLLVDPSTQGIEHRVKRNRYLFMIVVAVLTSNHVEFVKFVGGKHIKADAKKKPVKVAGGKWTPDVPQNIADADGIPFSIAQALGPEGFEIQTTRSEWEHVMSWETRLRTQEDATKLMIRSARTGGGISKDDELCLIHGVDPCPQNPVDKRIGECLDNQFRYLLYLCEQFQALMATQTEKVNLWLQTLARVDQNACVQMKGIRNDYASLLVGYLFHKELKGPFEDMPAASKRLPPLTTAIATYLAKRSKAPKAGEVPLSPVDETVEAFMNGVPKVEEGAFAFLSLSGNIFNKKSSGTL